MLQLQQSNHTRRQAPPDRPAGLLAASGRWLRARHVDGIFILGCAIAIASVLCRHT